MSTSLSRKVYGFLRSILRLCVISAVMLGVGKVMEETLSEHTFDYLAGLQSQAFAAVDSLAPFQIKDRYICALGPSVEKMNRQSRYHLPVSGDCMYSLSLLRPPSSKGPSVDRAADSDVRLPRPVVGHWAENSSSVALPFLALLDTSWHLVVQPSVFAAVFAISTLVLGGLIAGMLMQLPAFKWEASGPFGIIAFCIATIAAACAAAWGLRMLMEGGLYLFGRLTHLAGLCCGTAGLTICGHALFPKAVETRIHEGVDHVIPH